MIYIQSIFFVLICFCLIHLINKINFFQNEKYPHQNFTSRNFVLPVGGYLIILFLLIFNFKTINLNFFFVFFLFLIGALSDLKKFNSPKNRFIAQSLIVFIFIIYSDVKIVSTRLNFLDSLMENYYFSLCFVSFCFLILINGTNFIDGLNGLVVLYYISIILILNLSGLDLKLNTNNFFIDNILLILIFLFILNFIDKIYLGDGRFG